MPKPSTAPMRIKEGEICALRRQASDLLAKAGRDYASISAQMEQLAADEQKQLSLLKRQKRTGTLIEEEVRIEAEHAELREELLAMSWRENLSDQPIPPPIR